MQRESRRRAGDEQATSCRRRGQPARCCFAGGARGGAVGGQSRAPDRPHRRRRHQHPHQHVKQRQLRAARRGQPSTTTSFWSRHSIVVSGLPRSTDEVVPAVSTLDSSCLRATAPAATGQTHKQARGVARHVVRPILSIPRLL